MIPINRGGMVKHDIEFKSQQALNIVDVISSMNLWVKSLNLNIRISHSKIYSPWEYVQLTTSRIKIT